MVTTMIKLLAILTLTAALTGCYAMMPVKYAANQICGASSERKDDLADSLDKATFPHSIRVHCHAQEAE